MRRMLAVLIGTAASVTMFTGAGVASAAVGHPASAQGATGIQHFQIVGTSLSGNRNKVVTYGVFNASGIDRAISNRRDIFAFPGGSFLITHKPMVNRQHFNKTTCSGTFLQRGVYVLSRGSGKYAGISGHGRFTVNGLLVARHTAHGCSKRPIAVQTIVRAQGPVTLP